MVAPTAVPMVAPATRARTAVPTAVRTAALTAVPTVVRTAARTVPPDREPDLAGPGGARAPSGPAAVHEPRPAGLRRPLLVPRATAHARRRHRQLLHRPARPARG